MPTSRSVATPSITRPRRDETTCGTLDRRTPASVSVEQRATAAQMIPQYLRNDVDFFRILLGVIGEACRCRQGCSSRGEEDDLWYRGAERAGDCYLGKANCAAAGGVGVNCMSPLWSVTPH